MDCQRGQIQAQSQRHDLERKGENIIYIAKFYGRLPLIHSVLRASKFSVLILNTEIVFFFFGGGGGFITPYICFHLIWHVLGITFQLLN